jgi:cell division protein FtsW (lipid II flippase)
MTEPQKTRVAVNGYGLIGKRVAAAVVRHVVLGGVTVLLMFLAIGFGAAAFGKRFRLYSIVSVVVLLAFGALTFLEAPRLQTNLATPWIGLWGRINISVFLVWIVVLAIVLLRNGQQEERRIMTHPSPFKTPDGEADPPTDGAVFLVRSARSTLKQT